MKRSLLRWLGLLGVLSFLSYTAAVLFAPLAYPGYNWLSQAAGTHAGGAGAGALCFPHGRLQVGVGQGLSQY